MTTESKAAFYKATKFWILFVIALVVAAVLWRMWDRQDPSSPTAPPSSSQASVSLPDASEPEPEPEPAGAPVPPYDPDEDDDIPPQSWCGTGGAGGSGSDLAWDEDPRSVSQLIAEVTEGRDFYDRVAAIAELARRGATEAIPALERAAREDADDLVQVAAKLALIRLRSK